MTPAPWRMTQRPSPAARGSGPGVGAQTSRLLVAQKQRLAAGSPTGSLANGVSRFSRLLPAQVQAAPPALTMVPKRWVRDHVDPGQRRLAVAVEHDHVLAPIGAEAAEAVVERERRSRPRARLRAGAALASAARDGRSTGALVGSG